MAARGAARRAYSLLEDEESSRRSLDLAQRIDLLWVPPDSLVPSPGQPRSSYEEAGIQELAADIAEHGVLQPLLVMPPDPASGLHTIIAGERRWTAARLAGASRVPVQIHEAVDPDQAFLLAFLENVQRENLTPMDTATGLLRIRVTSDVSSDQELAEKVHKSLPWVRQMLAAAHLDPETRAVFAEQGEPIRLAVPLRAQAPEERRKTLAAVRRLPNADEKMKAVARVNDLRRQGVEIDQALSVAMEVAQAQGERAHTTSARGSATPRPRPFSPTFSWRSIGPTSVLDIKGSGLAVARLLGRRTFDSSEFFKALCEDLADLRDACATHECGGDVWDERKALLGVLQDGDQGEK